ncbi:hypothetical protein [Bremerella cremea]|uniref:hypothetical protein n=1 Tax=Bremerella cremea TaxID=1031537 RepID=UPI0031EEEB0C
MGSAIARANHRFNGVDEQHSPDRLAAAIWQPLVQIGQQVIEQLGIDIAGEFAFETQELLLTNLSKQPVMNAVLLQPLISGLGEFPNAPGNQIFKRKVVRAGLCQFSDKFPRIPQPALALEGGLSLNSFLEPQPGIGQIEPGTGHSGTKLTANLGQHLRVINGIALAASARVEIEKGGGQTVGFFAEPFQQPTFTGAPHAIEHEQRQEIVGGQVQHSLKNLQLVETIGEVPHLFAGSPKVIPQRRKVLPWIHRRDMPLLPNSQVKAPSRDEGHSTPISGQSPATAGGRLAGQPTKKGCLA